jgi:hypothetical protein
MATASELHETAAAAAAGPASWWRPIGWTKILARLMVRALVAWGVPESDGLMLPTWVIRSLFPRCCAGIRAQSDPQPSPSLPPRREGGAGNAGTGPNPGDVSSSSFFLSRAPNRILKDRVRHVRAPLGSTADMHCASSTSSPASIGTTSSASRSKALDLVRGPRGGRISSRNDCRCDPPASPSHSPADTLFASIAAA